MKSIVKLICVSSIALGLSACSITQQVLQGVYDEKADSDCRKQFSESNSTHTTSNSPCLNGRYDPTLNPNSKNWDRDQILKKKEEDEILKAKVEKHFEK